MQEPAWSTENPLVPEREQDTVLRSTGPFRKSAFTPEVHGWNPLQFRS
jgi:hypothetical protein